MHQQIDQYSSQQRRVTKFLRKLAKNWNIVHRTIAGNKIYRFFYFLVPLTCWKIFEENSHDNATVTFHTNSLQKNVFVKVSLTCK